MLESWFPSEILASVTPLLTVVADSGNCRLSAFFSLEAGKEFMSLGWGAFSSL